MLSKAEIKELMDEIEAGRQDAAERVSAIQSHLRAAQDDLVSAQGALGVLRALHARAEGNEQWAARSAATAQPAPIGASTAGAGDPGEHKIEAEIGMPGIAATLDNIAG